MGLGGEARMILTGFACLPKLQAGELAGRKLILKKRNFMKPPNITLAVCLKKLTS